MKIINDILQPDETPVIVTGINTSIKVECKYPKDSTLMCYIEGYVPITYFPLSWSGETTNDGLIFTGRLLFNKQMINYIAEHENNYLCFKIARTKIENKQKFSINYASIERVINALPNTYMQLTESVNNLSNRVDTFVNRQYYNTRFITDENKTIKGMIPVAVDNNGNYKWDFPFIKEKEILNQSINLLKDISKQISLLNDRVNTIEKKLMDHIYEGYE